MKSQFFYNNKSFFHFVTKKIINGNYKVFIYNMNIKNSNIPILKSEEFFTEKEALNFVLEYTKKKKMLNAFTN